MPGGRGGGGAGGAGAAPVRRRCPGRAGAALSPWRRVRLSLASIAAVLAVGTVGYLLLGFTLLDALYQTVTTVMTVGFREVEPFDTAGKIFTMALILAGAGTVLTTFSSVVEVLIDGKIRELLGRRRMDRRINDMSGHVILCGWGRVGRSLAQFASGAGQEVVVVDVDAARLQEAPFPYIVGDATDDEVLRRAGIDRARALVAAIDTDAENLFVTVSGRTLRSDLFIVARARTVASEDKLRRAGADRVVNPQAIGGERMAAFVVQPHVAEFVDVVMHDGSLEFRLEEVAVSPTSPLVGCSIRDAHIRDQTGALILALRHGSGTFTTNPDPDIVVKEGDILIAVGTADQLRRLSDAVA